MLPRGAMLMNIHAQCNPASRSRRTVTARDGTTIAKENAQRMKITSQPRIGITARIVKTKVSRTQASVAYQNSGQLARPSNCAYFCAQTRTASTMLRTTGRESIGLRQAPVGGGMWNDDCGYRTRGFAAGVPGYIVRAGAACASIGRVSVVHTPPSQ